MELAENTKTGNWKDKAAFLISLLLSPFILIPGFIYIVCYTYAPNVAERFKFIGVALLFSTVVPFLNVYIAVKLGKITDVHVAERKERTEPFIVALLSILIGTYALYKMGAPREIYILGLVMLLNGVIFFVITLFWKISMHLSILAGVITSLAVLVNPWYAVGYIFAPILTWARLRRQRHNFYQALTATIIAIVGTWLLFIAFKIPS